MHEKYQAVQKIAVHLENWQRVYSTPELSAALDPRKTTSTALFKLCSNDSFVTTLYYHQLPSYYTWNIPRQNSPRRKSEAPIDGNSDSRFDSTLSYLYAMHSNQQACFKFRMLQEARDPKRNKICWNSNMLEIF